MSKVLSTKVSFPPSESPDVVGYKLYLQPAPDPVTYSSPSFDLGTNTEVIISTLPGMDQVDGVYNMGVSSIDDAGNESDLKIMENVSLDFFAPAPPGDLVLVRD
jgi:hypothetical protein